LKNTPDFYSGRLNPYDLIGIPYALPSTPPDNFDCFSLVEYVREHSFNRATPLPYSVYGKGYDEIARTIVTITHKSMYRYVDKFVPGDIVQLEDCHIGVALPDGVLQAWRANGKGSVVCTGWRIVNRLFMMCRFLREVS
jgi:hypothetical protein